MARTPASARALGSRWEGPRLPRGRSVLDAERPVHAKELRPRCRRPRLRRKECRTRCPRSRSRWRNSALDAVDPGFEVESSVVDAVDPGFDGALGPSCRGPRLRCKETPFSMPTAPQSLQGSSRSMPTAPHSTQGSSRSMPTAPHSTQGSSRSMPTAPHSMHGSFRSMPIAPHSMYGSSGRRLRPGRKVQLPRCRLRPPGTHLPIADPRVLPRAMTKGARTESV